MESYNALNLCSTHKKSTKSRLLLAELILPSARIDALRGEITSVAVKKLCIAPNVKSTKFMCQRQFFLMREIGNLSALP